MSIGRLIGILVVIVVIYMIVTQPVGSANMTRDGVSRLGDAGGQMVTFVSNVVRGVGSGSSSSDRTTPLGGAATGDGSSAG